MDPYKLDKSHLRKLNKEFAETSFGKKAYIFSFLPLFVGICFLCTDFIIPYQSQIGPTLEFIGFIISFIGFCIAQLQYGNLLKDYIKTKKK